MRKKLFWSAKLIAQFVELCGQNVPRDEIAKTLGLKVEQVEGMHRRLRDTGRQPHKLPKRRDKKGKPSVLQPYEDEIIRLAKAGARSSAIGQRFGVRRSTVESFLKHRGLYTKAGQKTTPHSPRSEGPPAEPERVSVPPLRIAEAGFTRAEIAAGAWVAKQMEAA